MAFFLDPSTPVLRSFGMSANNNPDHIPEVLDPQHPELSQHQIHGILKNQ
jgi:hypothetical protein